MATFKHISSKNADYGAAEQYLTFEHDEFTMKPTLDGNGQLVIRDDYRISSLNCGEEDFAIACMRSNLKYGKNQKREDVKSHHYIISFDPRDAPDNGLTVDRAQALGEEFCKTHFPGHQALVCTHPDGHNHSGNIHVHIVINSIRKYDTEPQPYMEFDRDSKAGYKHHLSDRYRIYLKQKVMDMCTAYGLNQVDLLTPAERKLSEKEYWAKRRGQKKLDKHNAELEKKGLTPRQTTFQTEKQYLRDAIDTVASQAISQKIFPDCCLKNIILHSKSVVADTATCIPIAVNTLLEEALVHFMRKTSYAIFQENSTSQITENPVPDISQVVNSSTPTSFCLHCYNYRSSTYFPLYKI